MKTTDTETLASLLVNEIACRYGVHHMYLHNDQGVNLTSNLMASLYKQLGITQSEYHLQDNDQVGRFNQTLESMIGLGKVVSDQTVWNTHLLQVLFAYQTFIHNTTGFTPFQVRRSCAFN